ncbi:hypothetical protein A1O1_01435 [Capronia coronata CBS 617.96]|uniref:DNA-directed RNA polymerase RBP11-like dimerisation domain-containing protein n=1 Tax=Capronia coronata CBS 617.96 TaxID=1182541 RepID=W9ZP93_9EURO|nr:uncharacterized protein A1O1_01435 [Capronia coronata CBS 617.96]EXJ96309.1 hypothetical protein A1O1_01435 [Capronia coronata CBS 617.96]
MADAAETAPMRPSTTPPGSPPAMPFRGRVLNSGYPEIPASTTPPGSPPGNRAFSNALFRRPVPFSTTPPGTPRRFSTGQDIKGKARSTDSESRGAAANNTNAGMNPREAALAKAIEALKVAYAKNVPLIKETPTSSKAPGSGGGNNEPENTNNQDHPQQDDHGDHQDDARAQQHGTRGERIPDRCATARLLHPFHRPADCTSGYTPAPGLSPLLLLSVQRTLVTALTDIFFHNSTEAFLLGPGEKRIELKIDTRTPNTEIFVFNKEDHTLGGLLVDKLLKNSHVLFAAYRVPHPLFARFELRVQTDGEISPKEALVASSSEIIRDFETLKTNFTREYELRKMVGSAAQNNGA